MTVATLNGLTLLGRAMAFTLVLKAWRVCIALLGESGVPHRVAATHIGRKAALLEVALRIARLVTTTASAHGEVGLDLAALIDFSVVATGALAMTGSPWCHGKGCLVDNVTSAAAAPVGRSRFGVGQVVHFHVVAWIRIVLIKARSLCPLERAWSAPRSVVVATQAKAGGLLVALGSILAGALANTEKVLGVTARGKTRLVSVVCGLIENAQVIIAVALLAIIDCDGRSQVPMGPVVKFERH